MRNHPDDREGRRVLVVSLVVINVQADRVPPWEKPTGEEIVDDDRARLFGSVLRAKMPSAQERRLEDLEIMGAEIMLISAEGSCPGLFGGAPVR